MAQPLPTARRIVDAYAADFRAGLRVRGADADDPAALARAANALPPQARDLLDLLLLTGAAGDSVPDRFRDAIERDGLALWQAALLLPRASSFGEASLHPLHYAGACRLNPAARELRPSWLVPATATPSFPPADARWDAVVVAALLENTPGQLTQDGSLRKDVERRLLGELGADEERWTLAIRLARLTGLLRPAGGRLHGFPQAMPRPLADPAALLDEPAAGSVLLRLVGPDWIDVPALLDALRDRCRELLFSPLQKAYPGRSVVFDAAGWDTIERPILSGALDHLHRAGVVDLARDASGIRAVRRPGPRPAFAPGFLLAPDGDILVHTSEVSLDIYGRLARLAPFVEGDNLRRHRLTRDGAAADLAAGYSDILEFLAGASRTGLPPNIADMVREWQRSATRITVITGVDLVEHDDGRLTLSAPPPDARIIDYTQPPRMRFLSMEGKLLVLDGWDALPVRYALSRVAKYAGREQDARVWIAELRTHKEPANLLNRLRQFHGGELPGELEALIQAGSGLGPVVAEDAVLVRLPHAAAAALRRDRVLGPLLRRSLGADEAVVARADLPALRGRFAQLGLTWQGPGD